MGGEKTTKRKKKNISTHDPDLGVIKEGLYNNHGLYIQNKEKRTEKINGKMETFARSKTMKKNF